jgi:hypothetical protein
VESGDWWWRVKCVCGVDVVKEDDEIKVEAGESLVSASSRHGFLSERIFPAGNYGRSHLIHSSYEREFNNSYLHCRLHLLQISEQSLL